MARRLTMVLSAFRSRRFFSRSSAAMASESAGMRRRPVGIFGSATLAGVYPCLQQSLGRFPRRSRIAKAGYWVDANGEDLLATAEAEAKRHCFAPSGVIHNCNPLTSESLTILAPGFAERTAIQYTNISAGYQQTARGASGQKC
jgi:hypothetical protein